MLAITPSSVLFYLLAAPYLGDRQLSLLASRAFFYSSLTQVLLLFFGYQRLMILLLQS